MSHSLRCECGAVTGEISHTRSVLHAVCYCKDCRAFALHLGKSQSVLDAMGGTEVIATQARYVTFTKGSGHLRCLSLTPNGLLRWYAGCCRTPVANTPRDWKLPYVGLVHACLQKPLEASFPAVQLYVNTGTAQGTPPSRGLGRVVALLGFMPGLLWARVSGSYRQTPFFSADGSPIAEARVLSPADRDRAMSAARSL